LNKNFVGDNKHLKNFEKSTQDYVHIDVNPVIISANRRIILAKRDPTVFQGGRWHLPGGRLLVGETIIQALKRIASKKTGLDIRLKGNTIEDSIIGVYDDPRRDGREHVLALAFSCVIKGGEIKPNYNVVEVKDFSFDEILEMDIAFDHKEIIKDFLEMN